MNETHAKMCEMASSIGKQDVVENMLHKQMDLMDGITNAENNLLTIKAQISLAVNTFLQRVSVAMGVAKKHEPKDEVFNAEQSDVESTMTCASPMPVTSSKFRSDRPVHVM